MRQLTILLCAVLFLGVSSHSVLAQAPPSPDTEKPKERHGPPMFTPEQREAFRQRLGITEKQHDQLDKLFAESFKKRRELNERLRELFETRQKVCDTYEIDRSRERAIRSELNSIYTQLLNLHIDTEEKIRRILNREQFERLREMREEQRKKWQANRPRFPKDRGRPPSP